MPAGRAADLPELLPARGSHIDLGKKGTVDVPVGTFSVSSESTFVDVRFKRLVGVLDGESLSWGWVVE